MVKALILGLLAIFQATAFSQGAPVDGEAIHAIIDRSRAKFIGVTCICPYDKDAYGNLCGAKSLWRRPGELNAPLCYPSEVTPAMIELYRSMRGGASHPVGIISSVSSISSTTATNHPSVSSRLTFVFQNVIYRPVTEEGCKSIVPGMVVSMITVITARVGLGETNYVVLRMPDGSRCTAMAIGPASG